MNQPNIQKGTHFICGPINEKVDFMGVYPIYQEQEKLLNSFGFLTYNPLSFHQVINSDDFSANKFFCLQVSCLALCSTVVTIPGWQDCRDANKLVSIAHIMGKEVIHHSKIGLNKEIL